jgi:hypothetical protein
MPLPIFLNILRPGHGVLAHANAHIKKKYILNAFEKC